MAVLVGQGMKDGNEVKNGGLQQRGAEVGGRGSSPHVWDCVALGLMTRCLMRTQWFSMFSKHSINCPTSECSAPSPPRRPRGLLRPACCQLLPPAGRSQTRLQKARIPLVSQSLILPLNTMTWDIFVRVSSLVFPPPLMLHFTCIDSFSPRVSLPFPSYPAVCEFLQTNNLLSIIRAHEAQDAG